MIPEILISKTLGRDIKKFEAPIQHVSLNSLNLFEGQRGVQSCCSDTMAYQSVDLIFHQCDERRHHHRQSLQEDCGQLITERLSAACGEDRKGGAVGQDRLDDTALSVAERGEAKMLLQGLGQVCGHITVQDA